MRTRLAIVDACIDLIDEGDLRPTGPRIAERAGVSVRSVFQHFDDLDGLFSAVGARLVDRVAQLVSPIHPTGPVAERVGLLAAQRAQVSEQITPVMRAALVHSATSDVINQQFTGGHAFLRALVAEAFAPEMEGDPDREHLLRSLALTVSWPTWDQLRRLEGLTVEEAEQHLRWTMLALLRGAGTEDR